MDREQQILDAVTGIQASVKNIEADIQVLKSDVGTLKSDVGVLKSDVGTLKSNVAEMQEGVAVMDEKLDALASHMDSEFKDVRKDISRVESTMATKDYVDRRLTEAVAEIAPIVRKVDAKDTALVDKLGKDAVIPRSTVTEIKAMSPFTA